MTKRKSPQLIGDRTSRLNSALRHGANAAANGVLSSLYLAEEYEEERDGHLDSARRHAAELLDYLALRGWGEDPAEYIEAAVKRDRDFRPHHAAALEIIAAVTKPQAERDVTPGTLWAFTGNLSQAQVIDAERAGAR